MILHRILCSVQIVNPDGGCVYFFLRKPLKKNSQYSVVIDNVDSECSNHETIKSTMRQKGVQILTDIKTK